MWDLWRQRRFVPFFCFRAVDFRYKRALFGWFWLLVRSLLWMLPFSLVIGQVAGGDVEGVPYALFVLVSLTLWNYFANGVSFATLGLRYDREVTTQLGLSPLLLVIANVAVVLMELAVSIVFLYAIALVYYCHGGKWYLPPGSGLLLAGACVVLTTLSALGIGLITAILDEYAPDIRLLVPYLLSFWMLLTPVVYPLSAISGRYRWLAWLNPMTPVVESFRWSLLGVGHVNTSSVLWAAAAVAAVFLAGVWFFVRAQAPGR
jgi:lipopolysaccharide transport system permease protein